jgi:hypothetical protein
MRVKLCELETYGCVLVVICSIFTSQWCYMLVWKVLVIVVFYWYYESLDSLDFFPEYPDFLENPGLARTFQTFKHQISFAFLLSVWTVMSISLLPVAHHKHPTSVIFSCFSLCAKFGPKRTIDIQNQYAHIKGECYKRILIFFDYLL